MSATAPWGPFARLIAGRHDELRVDVRASHEFATRAWPDREPDRPYAVHLFDTRRRVRVLALDFDAGAHLDADLRDARLLLTLAGASFVEARSGPGGGRHLFVPFAQPLGAPAVSAFARAMKARWRSLDTSMLHNVRTGAIRPPGSPHRNGGVSEVLGDLDEALRLLTDGNDVSVAHTLAGLLGVEERALHATAAPLSPEMFRLLAFGEGAERYASLSEMVMALYLSVLARGHDPAWLDRRLLDGQYTLARWLQERPQRSGGRRNVPGLLRAALRGARSRLAQEPTFRDRSDALAFVERVAQAAAGCRWTHRAGLSELAVLEGHLEVARRKGGPVYNASQRELAELCMLDRRTVEKANARLVAAGWLKLLLPGAGKNATTWRLRLPGTLPPCGPQPLAAGPIGHAAFGWRHLGKGCARVLAALADGASGVTELAARTGLHPGTVRRCLGRLARLEQPLARRAAPRRWLPAVDADLEATARELGADRTIEAMRVRHDRERRLWHAWLEERERVRRLHPPPPRLAAPLAA